MKSDFISIQFSKMKLKALFSGTKDSVFCVNMCVCVCVSHLYTEFLVPGSNDNYLKGNHSMNYLRQNKFMELSEVAQSVLGRL